MRWCNKVWSYYHLFRNFFDSPYSAIKSLDWLGSCNEMGLRNASNRWNNFSNTDFMNKFECKFIYLRICNVPRMCWFRPVISRKKPFTTAHVTFTVWMCFQPLFEYSLFFRLLLARRIVLDVPKKKKAENRSSSSNTTSLSLSDAIWLSHVFFWQILNCWNFLIAVISLQKHLHLKWVIESLKAKTQLEEDKIFGNYIYFVLF